MSTTIHRLPDAAAVEQEASAWIARLHAEDVTPDDLARFNAWRGAHPRHAQVYEAMSATVDEIKRAGRIVRAVSFGNAMSAAADTASDHAFDGRQRRASWLTLGAAAALAVLAVALGWWTSRAGSQTLFQTSIGEHASVELPDGSRLELNSNSLARVEYSRHARTIRLVRGEAFFDVAHESQRPFWVAAGESWIRAVGTAFDVDLRPSGVRVVVREGTVKLATATRNSEEPSDALIAHVPVSILTAGQQAQMNAGGAQIRTATSLEMTRLSAWRKGKVYFENQHLESVVEELSRYTRSRITIEDEAIRQLPIGGTFQANAEGVETLLGMLKDGFGLRIRRAGDDHIYIQGVPAGE